ncbi:MAG: site-2 protease family protein [Patescibacteria group bacterium]
MLNLLSSVIAIIIAVTVHEFAHAWVAYRLGDPTAKIYGRVTLNPLKHFDLFGTISLVLFGIGWGKPVPFNPENLKYPRRDSAIIALSGPMANLLTALVLAFPIKYLSETSFHALPLYSLLSHIFAISVLLFALNILPFPPFDGSKMIGVFIPHKWHNAYENYLRDGIRYVIIFILFDVLILEKILHFSILNWIVMKITMWVIAIISLGT